MRRGIGKVGMARVRQLDLAICKFRRTLSRFRTKRLGDLAQSTRHRIARFGRDIKHPHLAQAKVYRELQSGVKRLNGGIDPLLRGPTSSLSLRTLPILTETPATVFSAGGAHGISINPCSPNAPRWVCEAGRSDTEILQHSCNRRTHIRP